MSSQEPDIKVKSVKPVLKDLSDFPIPTGPIGVIINMNLNEDSNLLFEPEKDKKQNVVIVNGSGELKNEGLW